MRSPSSYLINLLSVMALVGTATTWPLTIGPSAASILFLAAGLVFSLSLAFLPRPVSNPFLRPLKDVWAFVAMGCGILLSHVLSARVMDASPLRYEDADMIPILQAMAHRFLAGDWRALYDPIPEIWAGVQPIYLPFLWLPFTAAELFHFDPRWVTVAGIWVAAVLVLVFLDLRKGLSGWLLLYLLYALMRHLHTDPTHNVIRLTEEGVVYAWYALLAWSLVSRYHWLLGLAFSACLLSRYSAMGAFPAILLWRVLQGRWRSAVVISAIPVVLVLLSVLAFGREAIAPFTSLPAKYIDHARWVWTKNPEYMTRGLGLAKFFGPDHLVLQHSLLVWVSLLLPSLVATGVWLAGRRLKISIPNLETALVMLSLVCFHALVVVPYDYLFFTPVFFALVVSAMQQSGRHDVL